MTIRVKFKEDNAFEDEHEVYVRDTEMTWDTDLPVPAMIGADVTEVDLDYDETLPWYVIVAAVKGPIKQPSDQYLYEPGAATTPAAVFTAGEVGGWCEMRPPYLFQDAAGTVPVEADGDPIRYITDRSGNGNHWTQSTSASRCTYRTDGTLHWAEFDGVDDHLNFFIPFSQFTNGLSYYFAFDLTPTSGTFIFYSNKGATAPWAFVVQSGATANTDFADVTNSGSEPSVTLRADGVDVSPLNRDSAFTAVQGKHVQGWDASGATGGYISTSNLGMGIYGNNALPLSGKLFGLVWRESLTANEKTIVENWLAEQSGVTL